jgi:hypothetical protein
VPSSKPLILAGITGVGRVESLLRRRLLALSPDPASSNEDSPGKFLPFKLVIDCFPVFFRSSFPADFATYNIPLVFKKEKAKPV